MPRPIFLKSRKKEEEPERRERLVRVVEVGSARYIAIGRIAPDVKVGDLLLAVFYPKSMKILLTPYEAIRKEPES